MVTANWRGCDAALGLLVRARALSRRGAVRAALQAAVSAIARLGLWRPGPALRPGHTSSPTTPAGEQRAPKGSTYPKIPRFSGGNPQRTPFLGGANSKNGPAVGCATLVAPRAREADRGARGPGRSDRKWLPCKEDRRWKPCRRAEQPRAGARLSKAHRPL